MANDFPEISSIKIPTLERITAITKFKNGLLVFTENETFFLRKKRWYERLFGKGCSWKVKRT